MHIRTYSQRDASLLVIFTHNILQNSLMENPLMPEVPHDV
jgi:hypothetical protein